MPKNLPLHSSAPNTAVIRNSSASSIVLVSTATIPRMGVLRKIFPRWFREILQPPFSAQIPMESETAPGKSDLKLLARRLRPVILMRLTGQSSLQLASIEKGHKSVLWLYAGAPQIGDILMDVAGRVLLRDTEIKIDLYAEGLAHTVFDGDDVFRKVLSSPGEIDASAYDLVILNSFKGRCLDLKIRYLRKLPFVCVHGFFNGRDFNRTLFSFYRIRQLLGKAGASQMSEQQIQANARPHLSDQIWNTELPSGIAIEPGSIGIVVGGADPARTYRKWDAVIAGLAKVRPSARFLLLGSANGRSMRDQIMCGTAVDNRAIVDCVDQLSLHQSFAAIRRCAVLVCADGGLLHAATAAGVPTVSLFHRLIDPALRLVPCVRSTALHSQADVDALEAQSIVTAVTALLDAGVGSDAMARLADPDAAFIN